MAYELWSQDVFSRGELSPFMYARATVNEYSNGLKQAQNVLTYPIGAAGKRFGTLFQSILNFTNPQGMYFQTFQYLNQCVYQLVFYNSNIDIYLEGILIANVSTSLNDTQVFNISSTVLGVIFRVAGIGFKPYDLTRSASSPNGITTTSPTTISLTSAITAGLVVPITFTAVTSLPITSPQVILGVTYFAKNINTSDIEVYATAHDAKFGLNKFGIVTGGVSASVVFENTWTFAHSVFTNVPVYDFNGTITSYDALTFTPSAVVGSGVTITVSGSGYALLDSSYVGGAFIGAGGTSRITAVASATSFTVSVEMPFDSTDPIQGSLTLLAEPAWSDKRGWPQVCSSYQNRALFANTPSLPNGFYASVINDYPNFGDLTSDDDDAISWYPTSNNVNFIKFIVPYRSITVHTNTGIYSSPLSDLVAITPSNFTLQLQDSTPADVLYPVAIDNQVLVLSGNDAHQMLWDGINNAYTSNIVSIINEQTIRDPVDETPFLALHRAGSRFVFIINANGSMAIYQTLISENVSGFTSAIMEQSYGNAGFLQSASSSDGRAWFVVQRQIAEAASPLTISAISPGATAMEATSAAFSTTQPTAVIFTTSGSLPTSSPQITTEQYYWVVGIVGDAFNVFVLQEDAAAWIADGYPANPETAIFWATLGSDSQVVPWTLNTIFTLEELTHDTFLDCAVYYNGTPVNTVDTGILFNAQNVKMVGDGFGFDGIGGNNGVAFVAHGVYTDVSVAYIGFPINTIMEPMPLSMSNGSSPKNTTLTKPKHIRTIRFMFNNTIGGTINGVPISLLPFSLANIGEPPFPARGVFELSVMKGWDDFNNPSYVIEHSEPFNIQLLGVFYSVDI